MQKNDEAYQLLIKKFLLFYRKHLNNEKWGEQVSIKSNNQLELHLAFVDLDENSLNKIWQPFINELNQTPDQFKAEIKPVFIPGDKFWDIEYRRKNLPQSIVINPLSQQNNTYWWEGNNSEVSLYGHYYLSRYLPQQLLQDNRIDNLATAFYKASRNSDNLIIHFNKGQYNASADAVSRGKKTAMHPAVFNAIGLAIIANGQQYAYPQIKGLKPNLDKARQDTANANKAMSYINSMAADAGTYANEADYHESNWQQAFWGDNYSKLLKIKQKYDPDNFFNCHHCVGSEFLSNCNKD